MKDKLIASMILIVCFYISYAILGCASNRDFMYQEKKIADLELDMAQVKARQVELNRIDDLDKKVKELDKKKLDKAYIEREYNIRGVIELNGTEASDGK